MLAFTAFLVSPFHSLVTFAPDTQAPSTSQLRPLAWGLEGSTGTTIQKLSLQVTGSLIAKGLPSHTTPAISLQSQLGFCHFSEIVLMTKLLLSTLGA